MSNEKLARWAKKHQELQKGSGEWKERTRFDLKPGLNVIRIIPAKLPREDFWVELLKSFSIGPNNKTVTRPDQFGLPDAVADEIERLNSLEDEASKARASKMRAKKRAVMMVIDRNEEEKGAQVWETNVAMVLRDILGICADASYGDITDPETGVDLKINYTPGDQKKGIFPKWQILPERHSTPLGHPEVLESDLFEDFKIETPSEPDYIKACLDGTVDAYLAAKRAERAEESVESSAPGAPAPTPSAAPAGPEDEAVEAELAKIRKKKAKKSSPPPPPESGTPDDLLGEKWWAVINGKTQEADGKKVQALVDQGFGDMAIMLQSGGDWTTPNKAGFKKSGGAPPPPPQSQVGKDLEEALK